MAVYAVVLAGGQGERFWPLSRRGCPKQFLPLCDEATMLQLAVGRLDGLVRSENVYVVTGAAYRDLALSQVPHLPAGNVICEPFGRDTAAAIGLAAEHVVRRDPDGVMVVLLADHYISDPQEFRKCLAAAIEAAKTGEWVVTIGIKPSRPETGYGYIRQGDKWKEINGLPVFYADGFREKPAMEKALRYLRDGGYLWNSGMFVWRVDLLKHLLRLFLPDLFRSLEVIGKSLGTPNETEVLTSEYQKLPKISIDYGVMEKCDQVLVVPATFGWDDVGSWAALERHREVNDQGNIIEAEGVFLDTRGCVVHAPKRVVATMGIEDLIIVDGADALLVCHKERASELKRLVEGLKAAGYEHLV